MHFLQLFFYSITSSNTLRNSSHAYLLQLCIYKYPSSYTHVFPITFIRSQQPGLSSVKKMLILRDTGILRKRQPVRCILFSVSFEVLISKKNSNYKIESR